jgi:hypothetical protein
MHLSKRHKARIITRTMWRMHRRMFFCIFGTFCTFGLRFRIQQFHRSETYSVPLRYVFRFAPGALLLLLLLLRQLRIFAAAAAARAPTPPRPFFWEGREVPKKYNRL